jgi:CBS-domain-containing membrane protein
MEKHQIRRIPIVDDNNQIIGIIAQADIATRAREPETTAEVVEEISKSATA